MTLRRLFVGIVASSFALVPSLTAGADPPVQPAAALSVGVDALDFATQFPPAGRVFEYTDFFTGAYPVVLNDADGSVSKATGLPKIILGPSNFPITGGSTTGGGIINFNRPNGPPDCGIYEIGESVCTFAGGNDVEVAGPNTGVDWPTLISTHKCVPAFSSWNIQVNAGVGTYHFFCFIHPGMRGTLNVTSGSRTTITPTAVATQVAADRADALTAEAAVSSATFTGGAPGTRTYAVHMGISDNNKLLPSPFGVDCMNRYVGFGMAGLAGNCAAVHLSAFELVADPGNSLTHLSDPTQLVDSGVLIGTGYKVTPTAQDWSVTANSPGTYHFQCTIHDWMRQAVTIG